MAKHNENQPTYRTHTAPNIKMFDILKTNRYWFIFTKVTFSFLNFHKMTCTCCMKSEYKLSFLLVVALEYELYTTLVCSQYTKQ
jgi:hypothetical protein